MQGLLFALLLALSACSDAISIAESSRSFVDEYCEMPERARLAMRALVAEAISPHRMGIVCAGDDPVDGNAYSGIPGETARGFGP